MADKTEKKIREAYRLVVRAIDEVNAWKIAHPREETPRNLIEKHDKAWDAYRKLLEENNPKKQ